MLVETGRSIAWTFSALSDPAIHAVPIPQTVTRVLKVTCDAAREATFRAAGAALEDPALRRYNHTEYPNPGQELSRDYVLGGLGKGRWVLIELVLHARSNEAQGYLLEMVGVQDASTHPEWLADYRGQKKARK